MFTSKATLLKKTGPDRQGRYEFIRELVTEFNTTATSADCKRQILANLANFAYDPVNFQFLQQLHVIDVFLAQLSESENNELTDFAITGLCNIAAADECRDYIVALNGVQLVSAQLVNKNEETALNALCALYYLLTPESRPQFTDEIVGKIERFRFSSNPRCKNLGEVFMDTFENNDG